MKATSTTKNKTKQKPRTWRRRRRKRRRRNKVSAPSGGCWLVAGPTNQGGRRRRHRRRRRRRLTAGRLIATSRHINVRPTPMKYGARWFAIGRHLEDPAAAIHNNKRKKNPVTATKNPVKSKRNPPKRIYWLRQFNVSNYDENRYD